MNRERIIVFALMFLALLGTYMAVASNVSTPHTFVAGSTAVADEVNQNFAAHQNAINDNDARISVLESGVIHNGVSNLASALLANVTTNFAKIDDYLTFTKQRDNTKIEVIVNSRMSVGSFAGGATGVVFEIRIDDLASIAINNVGSVLSGDPAEYVSMFAMFDNLAAGAHTVSIWARTNVGTATTAIVDPSGWGGSVITREIQ